jgi:hypothetical protein
MACSIYFSLNIDFKIKLPCLKSNHSTAPYFVILNEVINLSVPQRTHLSKGGEGL